MVQEPNSSNSVLTDLGIKLNELEEKQRLLKDRILLIGNNLIFLKEEYDKQFLEIKKQLKQIDFDIKEIKQLNERIIYELNNSAKRSELNILKNQFKMFEPLQLARIKDVREIVKEELNKLQNKQN